MVRIHLKTFKNQYKVIRDDHGAFSLLYILYAEKEKVSAKPFTVLTIHEKDYV